MSLIRILFPFLSLIKLILQGPKNPFLWLLNAQRAKWPVFLPLYTAARK